MFAGEQSMVHRSLTSPIIESFGNYNSRYFTSPPSSSLTFDLPYLPAAQPHYSLPLPVALCDVTAEHNIHRRHHQPAYDLDPVTSLAFTGSKSLDENVIFSQQRVAAQPARRFKTASKHRGTLRYVC